MLAVTCALGCSGGDVDVYRPADGGSSYQPDVGDAGAVDDGRDVEVVSEPDASEPDPDAGVVTFDGPTRYDPSLLVSPFTANVVENLRGIRSSASAPDDAVFMKVGASGTVNSNFLDCFASTDVGGENAALQPTVEYFRLVDLDGQNSWDRDTLAAVVGRTASWVQTGSPSPLDQEVAAVNPRFALVNYGTNDMQQGITHQSALWPFWSNMWSLLTGLMADGIVPIVTGLNPRSDSVEAAYWVPTYNEVTRAMAQALQLPYLDLYHAVVDLEDMGLISDGIHGNAAPDGACRFDATGFAYNYNVRNLLTLQVLDRARRTVVDGEDAPEAATLGWSGDGSHGDPYVIDRIPFSHDTTTRSGPGDALDGYPSCDSGQDESGPEVVYRLDLDAPARLRAMIFDDAADIDIHHLDGALDGNACTARDDKIIQGTFAAGTHYFVADTYVGASGEQSGEFVLVVVECEAGDQACD